MYKYVADINKLSHNIISAYVNKFDIAIDATLGNGYDSDFLSENFKTVYAFDIQKKAIDIYKQRKLDNVKLINDTHENFGLYINDKVDCIMYNLGFLPGGDKSLTTMAESTLKSVSTGLELLSPGGIMTIAVYIGHEEGQKEEKALLNMIKCLPRDNFGVMLHTFANRHSSPQLIIIEKNMR